MGAFHMYEYVCLKLAEKSLFSSSKSIPGRTRATTAKLCRSQGFFSPVPLVSL